MSTSVKIIITAIIMALGVAGFNEADEACNELFKCGYSTITTSVGNSYSIKATDEDSDNIPEVVIKLLSEPSEEWYEAYDTIINNGPTVENVLIEEPPEDIWSIPVDIDENDVRLIANVIYGEARGIANTRDKAAVAWCILNRVDSTMHDFKKVNTIYEVITQPSQFDGYNYNNPTTEEFMDLARDVIHRWKLEKMGYEDVGRVLPKDYYWFLGDHHFNYFTNIWCKGNVEKAKANAYNWALGSPYEE